MDRGQDGGEIRLRGAWGRMRDHGGGARSRGPRAFSIKHVRIRCKDVNTRANRIRHLGHIQIHKQGGHNARSIVI